MASFNLCPWSTVFQYFSDTGVVLSGGLVYTYIAGTSTPQTTYTDITGVTPNANPIQLSSNGRLPNVSIWQPAGVSLKIIVKDSNGNQLGPTFDQLQGINDLVLSDSALSNPTSGSGADLVANAMRSYDVFATARAANVPSLLAGQTLIVDFEGGVTIADGLSGTFYWNAASTGADDNLTVLKPTILNAPGRYIRLSQALTFYAAKGASTLRASNTTITIDPDLQVVLPSSGTYVITGWLNDAGGSSAGGLKGQISYSGSINNGVWAMTGSGTAVTAVPLTAIGTPVQLQSAQTGVGSMLLSGSLQCTAGGTLSFGWGQQGSDVTASVLGAGSYLQIMRLSAVTGSFTPVTHTYNIPGTLAETIPVGASTVTIEVFGASGGGGGGRGTGCGAGGGGGGGGGGYSRSVLTVATHNGQTITYTVGTPGAANGGSGAASSVVSGTFALATLTGNGGLGGQNGGAGAGGTGGTASGGNAANTTGNAGTDGGLGNPGGAGAAALAGVFGNGQTGGVGGNDALHAGQIGKSGVIVFHYT